MKDQSSLTLRERIGIALLRLQDADAYKNYPYHTNKNGDPLPQCFLCGEVGLFHSGNGGILHLDECAFDLIHRIPRDVSSLHFFDQLAYKSVLRQITTFTQYPKRWTTEYLDDWVHFCPFCKTLPHNENCIVLAAQAELEQQGGQA